MTLKKGDKLQKRTTPFTIEEYNQLSKQLKWYYKTKRKDLLSNIPVLKNRKIKKVVPEIEPDTVPYILNTILE